MIWEKGMSLTGILTTEFCNAKVVIRFPSGRPVIPLMTTFRSILMSMKLMFWKRFFQTRYESVAYSAWRLSLRRSPALSGNEDVDAGQFSFRKFATLNPSITCLNVHASPYFYQRLYIICLLSIQCHIHGNISDTRR